MKIKEITQIVQSLYSKGVQSDGSDRRIVVEVGNLTSASITWSGTVFVKLVKYK